MGSGTEIDVTIYRELYGRHQVEGFILADTNHDDPRIAYLLEHNIPFASFGRANDGWDFCWVDVDGRHGMYIVVEHLLTQGHKRIGLITWPEGSEAGAYREAGYLEGLAAAGIAPNRNWLVRGENSVQTGAEGTARLLALPVEERPTAVMCVSDFIAIGALNTARAAGLQPGPDIAITGYDDLPMSQFFQPALTTIHQPIAEVSRQLADLLLKQLNGEPIAQKGILLNPRLVVRESSMR
jgi:DNA-binding LacI/PurR family transcriptional regulator